MHGRRTRERDRDREDRKTNSFFSNAGRCGQFGAGEVRKNRRGRITSATIQFPTHFLCVSCCFHFRFRCCVSVYLFCVLLRWKLRSLIFLFPRSLFCVVVIHLLIFLSSCSSSSFSSLSLRKQNSALALSSLLFLSLCAVLCCSLSHRCSLIFHFLFMLIIIIIIQFTSVEEAVRLRRALHDRVWPLPHGNSKDDDDEEEEEEEDLVIVELRGRGRIEEARRQTKTKAN